MGAGRETGRPVVRQDSLKRRHRRQSNHLLHRAARQGARIATRLPEHFPQRFATSRPQGLERTGLREHTQFRRPESAALDHFPQRAKRSLLACVPQPIPRPGTETMNEAKAESKGGKSREVAAGKKALAEVDGAICGLTDYEKDPLRLYAIRRQVAEALEKLL